jgi:hypothetical protein
MSSAFASIKPHHDTPNKNWSTTTPSILYSTKRLKRENECIMKIEHSGEEENQDHLKHAFLLQLLANSHNRDLKATRVSFLKSQSFQPCVTLQFRTTTMSVLWIQVAKELVGRNWQFSIGFAVPTMTGF